MNRFIRFAKGVAWYMKNGKRVPVDSLEEQLDALAKYKCIGIDTCKGTLWLKDQTTGEPVEFSVDEGKPVIKDKDGNVTFETTPPPE